MPKPVTFTNGYFACYDNVHTCKTTDGRYFPLHGDLLNGANFSPGVFFHLMGFAFVVSSIFHNVRAIVVSDRMMNESALADIIRQKKPRSAVMPPSILEAFYQAGDLDVLASFDFIVYGGGPILKSVGEELSKITRLVSGYGSTEAGLSPFVIHSDPKDWRYIEIAPGWGMELEPAEEGLFEGVIKHGPAKNVQSIFHSYPHLEEYRTKDLFSVHPTKSWLIACEGRTDDVIVLRNGEKFNPSEMELIIARHPKVKRAMILGQGRFEPALLIELENEKVGYQESNEELIESIWPEVMKANRIGFAHGRILKSRIGFADRNIPFSISPKGTVQRRQTIQDHEKTIEEIYVKPMYANRSTILSSNPTLLEVQSFTLEAISSIMGVPDLTMSNNLIEYGADSLHIFQIVAFIGDAIMVQAGKEVKVPSGSIYSNPTVEHIAKVVHSLIMGSEIPAPGAIGQCTGSALADKLVQKYTSDLPSKNKKDLTPESQHNIILTGSTGSLGSYILDQLLRQPNVSKIYCLNRSENGEEKQQKMFQMRGLDFEATKGRVRFYQARYGEPFFGLSGEIYEELISCIDLVLHNAWEVNFNLPLESFEEVHIRGVRRFIDFSIKSNYSAHIHFVSTRGTVGSWNPENGVVPENIVEEDALAAQSGYGRSKQISERILAAAASQSGVPVTIHRVGQVAGPTTECGEWNRLEWFPRMIITSKAIGKVPESLGTLPVDWVPVVRFNYNLDHLFAETYLLTG